MASEWLMLAETVGKAVAAYATLVLLVRLAGNRTLAKLRAFDLVVTIALGSVFASTVVSPSVSITQGMVAMTSLILLQYAVAWTATRSAKAAKLVTNQAVLLYHDGAFLYGNMKRARVTEEEILSAMRGSGHGTTEAVQTVILETDGEMAVLGRGAGFEPKIDPRKRSAQG